MAERGALERAIARVGRRWRAASHVARDPLATVDAAAFRSLAAERLRALERDLAEVRTRVNGLLFVVAGAAVTQVVLRLIA
ncbi:MAG: hypothetical protein WEC75_03530 [Dehalococcoidia bacterium]